VRIIVEQFAVHRQPAGDNGAIYDLVGPARRDHAEKLATLGRLMDLLRAVNADG
jgi:hypothetical protein